MNGTDAARRDLRDAIEETVKTLGIDRQHFHECSKQTYAGILRRFCYTFLQHDVQTVFTPPFCRLPFRRNTLECCAHLPETTQHWEDFIPQIAGALPASAETDCYLIEEQGWVYEGRIRETCMILAEGDCAAEDFCIISKKFDWCASYNADGECCTVYRTR